MPPATPNPQNPFTVGRPVPPDRFVGRTAELAAALDQIIGRSNIALWGGPGMGKTSLLNMLADPQQWQMRGYDPQGSVIIAFSCLNFSPFTATDFWREILQQLHDHPAIKQGLKFTIAPLLTNPSKDNLRSILRQLGKEGQYVVMLIDDYDVALQPHPSYSEADIVMLVSDCRNLCANAMERAYCSMVVTSTRRLNELGPKLQPGSSPWYNHYLFLPIKPFSEADTLVLMSGLPMTPGLRDGIKEMCDGHPALLQNAGHLLFRTLRSGQIPSPLDFAQEFQRSTQHLLEAQWQLASEDEQTLMMLIALINLQGRLNKNLYDMKDLPVVFSQKERELLDLVDQGVLVSRGRTGELGFAFASSIMERWVIEELENANEAWLTARQKIFLNLMSHRQAQTVTNAIRWLWNHREQIPSILEWLVKLSAAFPKGLIP